LLEEPSFAIRVADLAGQPVSRVFGVLPTVANRSLHKILEVALYQCLALAVRTLDTQSRRPPSRLLTKLVTGAAGGVGGVFGTVSLPIELPVTTMFILRSIAEIARHQGEDLRRTEARLACLEVFALADRRSGRGAHLGYYATRAALSRLTGEIAALVLSQGTIDAAAPAVARMVGEIATRFGIAVSERAAASALPLVGALGGATVNVIFTDHFQQIAQGHFTVRRLERRYGEAAVRERYDAIARQRQGPIAGTAP
jgi:hypothetical protein